MTRPPNPIAPSLRALADRMDGELHTGRLPRLLSATDASEYQELPLAVALPRSEHDLRELLAFARAHRVGLVPRTARGEETQQPPALVEQDALQTLNLFLLIHKP